MKMTLGKKLVGGFLIVAILFGIITAISYNSMEDMEDAYGDLVDRQAQIALNAREMQALTLAQANNMRGSLLMNDAELSKQVLNNNTQLQELISTTIELVNRQQDKEALQQMAELNKLMKQKHEQLNALPRKGEDDHSIIEFYESEIVPVEKQMDSVADALTEARKEQLAEVNKATAEKVESATLSVLTLSVIAVAVSILIGVIISRLISKPVQTVSEALIRVSDGDLTLQELKVQSKDEIGDLTTALNKMVKDLRDMVTQVKDASMQVAASSEELTAGADQTTKATEQIASATQQLASGSEEQMKSVTEAASAINQMSAGIRQIAANSEVVSGLAENASHASNDGVTAVNAVLGQMKEIDETVQETASIIRTLGDRSQEIGNIVGMITAIANQTNLLALNAAIEAARAGESGRGFAVVADEVRKLAEQSANSAKQIAGLIGEIRKETDNAVASMQQGTEKVADGMTKTQQVSQAFAVIENAVSNVTGKVQEVSAAVQQMAVGSQQIVGAIETVSKAAEEGAAASRQTSAASQEQLATMEEVASSAQALSRLAEDMQLVLTKFKL